MSRCQVTSVTLVVASTKLGTWMPWRRKTIVTIVKWKSNHAWNFAGRKDTDERTCRFGGFRIAISRETRATSTPISIVQIAEAGSTMETDALLQVQRMACCGSGSRQCSGPAAPAEGIAMALLFHFEPWRHITRENCQFIIYIYIYYISLFWWFTFYEWWFP